MSEDLSQLPPPAPTPAPTPATKHKKRSDLYWAFLFFSPSLCVVVPALVFLLIMEIGSSSFFQWNSMPEWLGSVLFSIGGILLFLWVIVLGVFSLFGPIFCSHKIVNRCKAHTSVGKAVVGFVIWVGILLTNGIVILTIGAAMCQALWGL